MVMGSATFPSTATLRAVLASIVSELAVAEPTRTAPAVCPSIASELAVAASSRMFVVVAASSVPTAMSGGTLYGSTETYSPCQ